MYREGTPLRVFLTACSGSLSLSLSTVSSSFSREYSACIIRARRRETLPSGRVIGADNGKSPAPFINEQVEMRYRGSKIQVILHRPPLSPSLEAFPDPLDPNDRELHGIRSFACVVQTCRRDLDSKFYIRILSETKQQESGGEREGMPRGFLRGIPPASRASISATPRWHLSGKGSQTSSELVHK